MIGVRALVSTSCIAMAMAASGPALAQQVQDAPEQTRQPQPQAAQTQTPPAEQAASQPPQGAENAPETFFVEAYDVSGVTRLSAAEVEALVYPFSGPGRTKDDVEAARKALQDAYAARGYEAAVVEIPVQPIETFSQGIVQIAVNEVAVGRVRVTDSHYHSLAIARGQVPSLREGQPVDFKALQSDIASANRFPDRTISPEFKPGQVPGTLDVDLKVDDQRPLHASLELSNDASPQTRPLRLTATARYTNLFQVGHSASITYVVAPERRKDTEVFAGSYTIPFLSSAWTLALSGYYSNSDIAALGGSNVLGKGYQVGLRAVYRLPTDRTVQTISFGPDFKDFKQNILVGGKTASDAPIRYVPFELQYALAGATEHSNYTFSLGGTAGVRVIKKLACFDDGGNCVLVDQFRNREQDSNENFVRGNLSASYEYAWANDIIGSLRLSGQLADSHLITNEQFALGGLSSVRGYYSAEGVGDNGVSGSIEFKSPSFAGLVGGWMNEARLYGFIDGGLVHVVHALPGQNADFRLVGAGGGLKLRLLEAFTGNVLVSVPLTDGPVANRFDPRVSFVVRGEF